MAKQREGELAVVIGDERLDCQAARAPRTQSPILDFLEARLAAWKRDSPYPEWPPITVLETEIAAVTDVLVLAQERIGGKESYSKEDVLRAMAWAALAAVNSSEGYGIMTPEARRHQAGNLADGRDSWIDDDPPVPLFDEQQGEKA